MLKVCNLHNLFFKNSLQLYSFSYTFSDPQHELCEFTFRNMFQPLLYFEYYQLLLFLLYCFYITQTTIWVCYYLFKKNNLDFFTFECNWILHRLCISISKLYIQWLSESLWYYYNILSDWIIQIYREDWKLQSLTVIDLNEDIKQLYATIEYRSLRCFKDTLKENNWLF